MRAALRLNWYKAQDGEPNGYRLEPRVATPGVSGGIFIVPRNRRRMSLPIVGGQTSVLFDLANAPHTPDGILAFCHRWGLLGASEEMERATFFQTSMLLNAALFGMWFGAYRLAGQFAPGGLIRPVNSGRESLSGDGKSVFREPMDLQDFCFLELMELIADKTTIRKCAGCGGFYAFKRSTKWYCKPGCRQARKRRRDREPGDSPKSGAAKATEQQCWTELERAAQIGSLRVRLATHPALKCQSSAHQDLHQLALRFEEISVQYVQYVRDASIHIDAADNALRAAGQLPPGLRPDEHEKRIWRWLCAAGYEPAVQYTRWKRTVRRRRST